MVFALGWKICAKLFAQNCGATVPYRSRITLTQYIFLLHRMSKPGAARRNNREIVSLIVSLFLGAREAPYGIRRVRSMPSNAACICRSSFCGEIMMM